MLVQTAHCSDQENWALLEVHPTLGLGKTTRWTNLLTAVCRNVSYLILSPQRGVWRTTRLCWRFRRPGLWRATRGLCSARTTPSTSSSGSQWYAASCLFKTMWQCKAKERTLKRITPFYFLHNSRLWAEVFSVFIKQVGAVDVNKAWRHDWQVACWCRHTDLMPQIFHHIDSALSPVLLNRNDTSRPAALCVPTLPPEGSGVNKIISLGLKLAHLHKANRNCEAQLKMLVKVRKYCLDVAF